MTLPDEVARLCRAAAEALGLCFAGIDVKRTPEGAHVFLEANSSPIYLDVERKLKHPITERVASRLLDEARAWLKR